MVQIELKWQELKTHSKLLNFPIDEEILKKYAGDFSIESKYDLMVLINDYIRWNDNINLYGYLSDEEQEVVYEDVYPEILNMEDLLIQYSHLIQPPKEEEYNCCSQYTTNYCPECGKKL